MRIRLDNISAHNLGQLSSSASPPVEVRIYVGEGTMITQKKSYSNNAALFPDIYEFEIDDIAYVMDLLELEVEVLNMSNPDSPVELGQGKNNMRLLIPKLNEPLMIAMPLESNGGKKGELRMKVVLNLSSSVLDDLRNKCLEADELRKVVEDYENQLREMDKAMEENIQKAQHNIDKSTKKYNHLTEKFNDLQEKYMAMSVENEKLQHRLLDNKDNQAVNSKQLNETLASLKTLNDELTGKVSLLAIENETIKQQLKQEKADKEALKSDLEELHTVKYEIELIAEERASGFNKEREAWGVQNKQQVDLIAQLNKSVVAMTQEIERLKSQNISSSITFNNTFIANSTLSSTIVNNSYIESIMNSTTVHNNYLTTILQSPDLEKVKIEFCNQMRRVDTLTQRNVKLTKRLYEAIHPVAVYARTRPPNPDESSASSVIVDNVPLGSMDFNYYVSTTGNWVHHTVDAHYAYEVSQGEVFGDLEHIVVNLVPTITDHLEGGLKDLEEALVMCYGGQGSGRTFTMYGFGVHAGIAYRALQRVFELLVQQKTLLAVLKGSKEKGEKKSMLEDMVLSYTMSLSLLEVQGEGVYDLLGEKRENLAGGLSYDQNKRAVSMKGAKRLAVSSLSEAIGSLASTLNKVVSKGEGGKSSLCMDLSLEVSFDPSGPPFKRVLRLVDLPAHDITAKDTNLSAVESIFSQLNQDISKLSLPRSPLVTWLRPTLSNSSNKIALILTFSPAEAARTATEKTLEWGMKLRHLSRPPSAALSQGGEMKTVKLKMRTITNELKEAKARNVMVEETLLQTKSTADDLVRQFNERNKLLLSHYTEEKSLSKQLQHDLTLTHRHCKRLDEELKEQKKLNDKLVQILKVIEEERQAAMSIRSAQAQALQSPAKESLMTPVSPLK